MLKLKLNSNNFRYFALIGLSFAHVVTFYFWWTRQVYLNFQTDSIYTSCYPFFSSCFKYGTENLNLIKFIFLLYGLIALACFFLSFLKKTKSYAYLLFLFLFLFKLLIYISRYNTMGAYHIMHFTMCLVLLFNLMPTYRLTLALNYFLAGLLKLDLEWVSGASIYGSNTYILPQTLFSLSLSYVILLEIVLIWGICFKNQVLRRLTLAQLIAFHVYSYTIVGGLYPLIMAGILLPLFYEDFFNQENPQRQSAKNKKIKISHLSFIFIIVFWNFSAKLKNIEPYFDGEIRYFSLYMFDAMVKCNFNLYDTSNENHFKSMSIPKLNSANRVQCDPLYYQAFLKKICIKNPTKSLEFYLEAKKTTSAQYKVIRHYEDMCQEI